jgi:hypothetical protein
MWSFDIRKEKLCIVINVFVEIVFFYFLLTKYCCFVIFIFCKEEKKPVGLPSDVDFSPDPCTKKRNRVEKKLRHYVQIF